MHRVGRGWFGGRIYLSDQRLFFCPGVLLRGRHGVLRVPLAEIRDTDVVGRKLALASISDGGLRPRLRITTSAGEQYDFSMQRFGKRASELQGLLGSAG